MGYEIATETASLQTNAVIRALPLYRADPFSSDTLPDEELMPTGMLTPRDLLVDRYTVIARMGSQGVTVT